MVLALLLACTGGPPPSPEACAAEADVARRDECFAVVLPELFRTDPQKGIEFCENAVTDPTVRDFIYLTVTRDVDPNSNKYCERIKDPVLAERCLVLVSRPHLHRGLVQGGRPARTPMGGAPPGVPVPPPPPGGGAPVVPGGVSNGTTPPPTP